MKLILHRGIATTLDKSESVINNIKRNGLFGDEGKNRFSIPDISNIRSDIEKNLL
jgi:hypothetical protein